MEIYPPQYFRFAEIEFDTVTDATAADDLVM